jgi:TonB-linked SusC/RagA family outer membrane protein
MKVISSFVIGALLLVGAAAMPVESFAQSSRSVSGVVLDENVDPVIGANVVVPGTSVGAATDLDGKFRLEMPSGTNTIFVTYLGYQEQMVTVGGQTQLTIRLTPESQGLDEVVVIGYGTVKKRDLTGAVQSIKNEDIVKTPTSNVMEALAGRVAGLNISLDDGRAGADVTMTLRGSRSINGSNKPYFIIDGVPGDYSDLNLSDVESVEVLKDASSTAIYGSAGANGVIIITTKSGNKNGKLTAHFDAYFGVNGFIQFPAVRTGDDYIQLRREANRAVGTWNPGEPDDKLFSNAEWDAIQNNQWVDWLDEGTRDGVLQSYAVSFSGGTEKTRSYFSLSYHDVEGLLKNDAYTRYGLKATIDHQLRPWMNVGLNLTGSMTDRDERRGQYFTRVLYLMPLGTPYNEDGSINPFPLAGDSQLSPIADMDPEQYQNNRQRLALNPTAYMEIKPIKGLSVKTMLSSFINFSRQGVYNGPNSSEGYSKGIFAQITNRFTNNYKWENILNYNFTIKEDHNFAVTGVTSWSKDKFEESVMKGNKIDYAGYLFHRMEVSDPSSREISSRYEGQQTMSYVARLIYNYKGRYLFSVSNRTDGSSTVAIGHNWDNFPAASAAWRISDEAFMENLNIHNLKLRVGYGVTGNAGVPPYSTLPIGQAGTNLAFQETPAPYYMFNSTVPNSLLSWEKSYGSNIGIDLGLLKGRVEIVLDAYKNDTEKILYQRTLPSSTGGSKTNNFSIWENICSTLNRGVELVVNSTNIKNKDFTWTSALTFASNHEEITSFTSDAPVVKGNYWLTVGYPINSYYDYKYAGIFQTEEEAQKYNRHAGDVKIVEVPDEDGNVNNSYGTEDRQMLGSAVPSWTAGLLNTFSYKGIDLSFFFDARWGHIMNYALMGWYNPSGQGNGPAFADYWTPENTGAYFPRPNTSYVNFASMPTGTNSLVYIDASYVKLRNISLGYSLPKNWVKKATIEKCRVYATLSNPWIYTKSKYLRDYDPERGGADEFPLTRQVVVGVNLTF